MDQDLRMLLTLIFTCVLQVQTSVASNASSATAAYMDAAATHQHFNGAVVIYRRDRVVFSKGFGLADRERKVPNGAETQFRIGSISKSITAIAVLQLAEKGQLRLTDRACAFLNDCDESWAPITIADLLSHRSGLPDLQTFPGFSEFKREHQTGKSLWQYIKLHPPQFAAGSRFYYSNTNFLVLGLILERVANLTYGRIVERSVFSPASMRSSGYDTTHPRQTAVGYRRQGNNYLLADSVDMSVPFAAGGLYSTASDLVRFCTALVRNKLLSAPWLARMWTDTGDRYGLGWFVERRFGHRVVGHNGDIEGFSGSFRVFPDDNLVVVVLSNVQGTNTERIVNSLAAIEFGQPYQLPRSHSFVQLNESTVSAYAGRYRLPWGKVIAVTPIGNKIMAIAEGEENPIEWKAESRDHFYVPTIDVEIVFIRDADRRVTGFIFNHDAKAVKVE